MLDVAQSLQGETQPPPTQEDLATLLDRLLTDEYGYGQWRELRSLRRIVQEIEASPWLAARVQAAREQGHSEVSTAEGAQPRMPLSASGPEQTPAQGAF